MQAPPRFGLLHDLKRFPYVNKIGVSGPIRKKKNIYLLLTDIVMRGSFPVTNQLHISAVEERVSS
jgi:hypothetical protein